MIVFTSKGMLISFIEYSYVSETMLNTRAVVINYIIPAFQDPISKPLKCSVVTIMIEVSLGKHEGYERTQVGKGSGGEG